MHKIRRQNKKKEKVRLTKEHKFIVPLKKIAVIIIAFAGVGIWQIIPHISIEKDETFDSSDAFATTFSVKNTGFIPAYIVSTWWEINRASGSRIVFEGSKIERKENRNLFYEESITVKFEPLHIGGGIQNGDVIVGVTWELLWMSFQTKKRFEIIHGREGRPIWVPNATGT